MFNQRILFSEVWNGVDQVNTKILGSKYKNDMSIHIYISKYSQFSIVLPLIVSRSLTNYIQYTL